MLYLEMWLCGIKIASKEIEYEGMKSLEERERHQRKIAFDMQMEHREKVKVSNDQPVFFITGNVSIGNDISDPMLDAITWKQLKSLKGKLTRSL